MNSTLKAIFFDLDGTLLDPVTHKPELETLQAVAEAKNRGFKTALATGKSMEQILKIEGLDLISWDGYVTCGGAKVYDQNKNLISDSSFGKSAVRKILKAAAKAGIPVYCSGKDTFVTDFNEEAGKMLDTYGLYPVRIDNYDDQEIDVLSFMCQDIQQVQSALARVRGIQLLALAGNDVQIVPASISKKSGVQTLMKSWNLPVNACITFGDGISDLGMIEESALGCAMPWAAHEVIQAADWICSNTGRNTIADGIWDILHQYRLAQLS